MYLHIFSLFRKFSRPFGNAAYERVKLARVLSVQHRCKAVAAYETNGKKESLGEADPAIATLDLNFTDHQNAFKTKTTWELCRALLVLRLCSFDRLVDNSLQLFRLGQKVLGERPFRALVKPIFYDQFVAGDDHRSIGQTVSIMQKAGLAPLLAVCIEDGPTGEVGYDANLTTILDCIQMASELSKGRPMIQLKVTALMPAELLVTLSKMYTSGGISIEQVAEAMYTPSLLYEVEGLPEAEIRQWCRGLERLREAGEFAQRKGVYILVDAECTHMNPGISLAALAMMLNFNKDIPLIWNTYQCYLKEAYNAITADYATIMDKGLCFGAKIVRGAYINCEEEYAKRQGVPNPVCDSYKDTSSSYNRVVETMLHNISHCGEKCNIIVASHNEESVRKAIQGMEKLGIARDSGLVYFGQLLGMCDQVSYPLGQAGYQIYKSLPYGTVEETLPYLSRRAQENKSVLMGARKERSLLQKELRRRFLRF